MRVLLLLVLAATGCIDDIDARWQLDHDRIIAVRATPPRIMPGERAELDGLVAYAGAPTAVALPAEAAVLDGPEALRAVVSSDGTHWFVDAPPEETLVAVRGELGLAPGAAVPVNVYSAFLTTAGAPLYARKIVWLGAAAANPIVPVAKVDDAPMSESLVVPLKTDVYLSVAVAPEWRVSWLSSCGQLFQDDVATSFLRVAPDDPTAGQLAVVVRDPDGGVAWSVWPIRAQ